MTRKPKRRTPRTNTDRADDMKAALLGLYGVEVRLDPRSVLIDALTDLRHWHSTICPKDYTDDAAADAFGDAIMCSMEHWQAERNGDTE